MFCVVVVLDVATMVYVVVFTLSLYFCFRFVDVNGCCKLSMLCLKIEMKIIFGCCKQLCVVFQIW